MGIRGFVHVACYNKEGPWKLGKARDAVDFSG